MSEMRMVAGVQFQRSDVLDQGEGGDLGALTRFKTTVTVPSESRVACSPRSWVTLPMRRT